MVNIGPIGPQGPQFPEIGGAKESSLPAQAGQTPEGRSFKDILSDEVTKVNSMQADADLSLQKYLAGEASEDEVMVAFKKAQIAFESLMQIRNKLVDAFEEIQRMRI